MAWFSSIYNVSLCGQWLHVHKMLQPVVVMEPCRAISEFGVKLLLLGATHRLHGGVHAEPVWRLS